MSKGAALAHRPTGLPSGVAAGRLVEPIRTVLAHADVAPGAARSGDRTGEVLVTAAVPAAVVAVTTHPVQRSAARGPTERTGT